MARAEWDALVHAQEEVNPFVLWDWLQAMEESKSAVSAFVRAFVSVQDSSKEMALRVSSIMHLPCAPHTGRLHLALSCLAFLCPGMHVTYTN